MKRRHSGILFYGFCTVSIVGVILLARSWMNRNRESISPVSADDMTVTMTDSMATELLQNALPEGFPVSKPEMRFVGDEIEISGTAVTETILSRTAVAEYPELDSVRRILPQTVFFRAAFRAEVQNGSLQLSPSEFQLGEFRIPLGFLPGNVKQTLGELLAQQADRVGFRITAVRVTDGQLSVSAAPNSRS